MGGRELTLALPLPPHPLTSPWEGLIGILGLGSFVQVQGRPVGEISQRRRMEKMNLNQEVLCGLRLPLCAVRGEPEARSILTSFPALNTEAINLSGWSASPHPHLPTQVHTCLPLYSHKVLTDPSPRLSAFRFHPGRWAVPLPPHSPGVRETHSTEPQGPGRRKRALSRGWVLAQPEPRIAITVN